MVVEAAVIVPVPVEVVVEGTALVVEGLVTVPVSVSEASGFVAGGKVKETPSVTKTLVEPVTTGSVTVLLPP